jgi:hypothetical protein
VPELQALYERLRTSASASVPDDDYARRKWPTLFLLLTNRKGLASGDRQGTSISITSEGADYFATISVRGYGKTLTTSFDNLKDMLDHLETAVSDLEAPWKPLRGWKEKKEQKQS